MPFLICSQMIPIANQVPPELAVSHCHHMSCHVAGVFSFPLLLLSPSSFLYSQNKMVGPWPEYLGETIKSLPWPEPKPGIPQCVETMENICLLGLQGQWHPLACKSKGHVNVYTQPGNP